MVLQQAFAAGRDERAVAFGLYCRLSRLAFCSAALSLLRYERLCASGNAHLWLHLANLRRSFEARRRYRLHCLQHLSASMDVYLDVAGATDCPACDLGSPLLA